MTDICVHCGQRKAKHDESDACPGGRTVFATMNLPVGKTCGDCFAFGYCSKVIGLTSDSTECDFFPVRFREKRESS